MNPVDAAVTMDRDLAAWLNAGLTEAAPEPVLSRSLAAARATRQRPRLVAVALGAPTLPRPAAAVPRLAWLVALLILVLATIAVAAGVIRPLPAPVIPLPSASRGDPSPTPTQPSPPPRRSATPAPTAPPSTMQIPELGFAAVPLDATRVERSASRVRFDASPERTGADGSIPDAIVVDVGPTDTGVVLELPDGAHPSVSGRRSADLDEALRSIPGWIPSGDSTTVTIGGEPATVVTLRGGIDDTVAVVGVVHEGRVFVISAIGTAADLPRLLTLRSALLEWLGRGFRFLDGGVADGGAFSVAYPPGWHRSSGVVGGGSFQLARSGGPAGLPGLTFGVTWAGPDEPIAIDLGQGVDAVTVTGHDLASLDRSVRAAFPGAVRTAVRIGGERGYRYGVGEESYVMPLSALAVTWHDGTAYVFTEHPILDAPPSRDFATLLAGVRFG